MSTQKRIESVMDTEIMDEDEDAEDEPAAAAENKPAAEDEP